VSLNKLTDSETEVSRMAGTAKFLYGIEVFLVVLFVCETWFAILRDESRLRVFEKRVFGPKKDEVTGEWS